MPMPLGERGPRRIRLWEEARPRLGRETTASGIWNGWIWDGVRRQVGMQDLRLAFSGGQVGCSKSRKIKIGREATAPLKGRAFKIEISKVSGSTLVAENFTDPHNRLLRRQHCSSLCSQSEGHEHIANMASALGYNFVGFSARACPPQYSLPSVAAPAL